MKYATIRNERGSITVFTIGAVVLGVTFLLVVANIGNKWLKQDLAQDAAEMLAPLILDNQLTHDPANGSVLAQTLANDAKLAQGFGTPFRITYQFGNYNDAFTIFTPILKADPKDSDFGKHPAVAVQVTATPTNIGRLFDLNFADVTGKAIFKRSRKAVTDQEKKQCICNCFFFDFLCWGKCFFSSFFTLNPVDFLAAFQCLFEAMMQMLVSTWNWMFTTGSSVINISG